MKLNSMLLYFVLGVFYTTWSQDNDPVQKRWEQLSEKISYERGNRELKEFDNYYSDELESDDLEETEYSEEKDYTAPVNQKLSEEDILSSRENKSAKSTNRGTAPLKRKEIRTSEPRERELHIPEESSEPSFTIDPATWRVILIVFAVIIALLLIYYLFIHSRKPSSPVSPSIQTTPIDPTAIEEDEYTRQLNEALKNGDYRLALRLNYLKVLRVLIEQKLIVWTKEKTNAEYLIELRKQSFHGSFRSLVVAFDRVWYGAYTIDEIGYKQFEGASNKLIAKAVKNEG